MYEFQSGDAAEKLGLQQVVFRKWGGAEASAVVCDCSSEGCAESFQIAPAEYERVRAHGACFVVVPGHELPEVERVVEQGDGYVVVEKVGRAAAVAREADPRHA